MQIKFIYSGLGASLIACGCATAAPVYNGPNKGQPHAVINFEQNYFTMKEPDASEYADEVVFAQNIHGNTQEENDANRDCENIRSITALHLLKKKKVITVSPDKPFKMIGTNMYGYNEGGNLNVYKGSYKNEYKCTVVASFTPELGKEYVAKVMDGENGACFLSVYSKTDDQQVSVINSSHRTTQNLTESAFKICKDK